ncbi:MAG TPA: hypothetical protein VHT03_10480 [Rhizomicrobium sp.]|nr:hypothetical protein [Rhizomicrobium sp.]
MDLAEHHRNAVEARKKAFACSEPNIREIWLTIARMWDDVAKAHDRAGPTSAARPQLYVVGQNRPSG